jgi:hypothetical protein
MCGLVSEVLHAVLTRAATLRALFDANIPGPDAPLWTIDLLVDDNDRDLGRSPIVLQLLNLGRTVLRPNYGQRARRSSPGPAPDPARRRLADIA